jgi:hypothetical protein
MSATTHRPSFLSVAAFVVLCGAVPGSVLAAIRLPATKPETIEIGRQHRTAWELYKAFEKQANGAPKLNAAQRLGGSRCICS